jgi:Arylsulfotransferase (ASST)
MGPGATSWFQHHALPQGPDTLSIFDDGGSPPVKEAQSRAILLNLDTSAMRVTLNRSYVHPARLLAANQGSMQVLANGRVLVGWGNLPYFPEFAADGTLIETMITVNSPGPYFAVNAEDASGRVLARSATVLLDR